MTASLQKYPDGRLRTDRTTPYDDAESSVDERPTSEPDENPIEVVFDDLLDLLSDKYACAILQQLADDAMPARTIAEATDISRPTVYRRLDRLTEAGVVRSRMSPDPDGHHRQEFYLVLEEVAFRIHEDGIDGTVPSDSPHET